MEKRVNIDIIDDMMKFNLSKDNALYIKHVLNQYKVYLNSLKLLGNNELSFLKELRRQESINNQIVEGIEPFLIQMYYNSNFPSATILANSKKIKNSTATINDLYDIHYILLKGLKKANESFQYKRLHNNYFVGTTNYNITEIDYYALDIDYIDLALEFLLEIYNMTKIEIESDIFIQPIILEILVSALQCFPDGNTRLARILKTTQIWNLTNNNLKFNTKIPSLYTSEAIQILNKRSNMRQLINILAINPNEETFNEYINDSLEIIDEQIMLNQNRVEKCFRSIKKLNLNN